MFERETVLIPDSLKRQQGILPMNDILWLMLF